MTAVESVIKKLVSDYEFVIIPGFGALLSRQIPAAYDQDSGIFSPAAKKLAFNEFLKLDDGFLANYISREDNIPHADAVTRIKEYMENLKSSLLTKGETKIEGVGYFNTNGEGKLVFEPQTSSVFKDEWYGFTKIAVKAVEVKKLTPAPARVLETVADEPQVLELNESAETKVNWGKWVAAAAIVGIMCFVSFFLVNSGNFNLKSTLNPFEYNTKATDDEMKDQKEEMVAAQPAPEPIVETKIEEAKVDSATPIATKEVVKIEEPAKVEVPVPVSSKKFYLIAGAFNGTKRANILVEDLKTKGYENAVVIPAGKCSSKVTVAAQSFDNEQEAYSASGKLKKVIGEPGWVLKIKE